MSSPRIFTDDTLPLVWSILGSSRAASGVGSSTLLRHLEQGDFDADIDGVDASGRSLVSRWLHALGTSSERNRRWGTHDQADLALLHGLLARGSDPWQKGHDGRDALDMLFEHGLDELVVEMAHQSPDGPESWKQRRVKRGAMDKVRMMPWLHAVAQNDRWLRADIDRLLTLPDADINQEDDLGNTPLFYVSSPDAARCLLERGANPSHRNHAGEGALGWWASCRIPATDLGPMKVALQEHGLNASAAQMEDDFRELAKTSSVSVLAAHFAELALEDRAVEFVPAALDRIFSCGSYDRQKVKSGLAWLAFLIKKPNAIEGLPAFDQARLHLLANAQPLQEADANAAPRQVLRDQLAARAPMEILRVWEELMTTRDFSESGNLYVKVCLDSFRRVVGSRVNEGEDLADLWFRMTLRDDPAASILGSPLPLVPWLPAQKEEVDVASHPRAWELLAQSAEKLNSVDFGKALDVLLQRNTPLPSVDFACPPEVDGEKRALIENAIQQKHTPQVAASRPSRRI